MILNGDSIWMPVYSWVVRAFGVIALCLVILPGFGGCSSDAISDLTVYPVKGKVLLADGKPLTTGRVTLVGRGEAEFYGPIGQDGLFSIMNGEKGGVPKGKYIVRIDPELPKGLAKGKPKSKKQLAFPFPRKYADESTSGLTVVVQAGPNDLEPFKLDK